MFNNKKITKKRTSLNFFNYRSKCFEKSHCMYEVVKERVKTNQWIVTVLGLYIKFTFHKK